MDVIIVICIHFTFQPFIYTSTLHLQVFAS